MLSEISPNGEEYFRFFRQECRRHGVSIAAVETSARAPTNLATNLDNLRRVEPDALVYMGYGMLAAKGLLREALDKLGWDPPRIMGTAFMFYLMGFDKFEGWVGIDQFDPRNPLVAAASTNASSRATARIRRCGRTRSRCSPTTPRACSSRDCSARRSSPGPGLKAGLETIRFMPSTTGGAHTHIACSPVRARDVPRRLAALRPGAQRRSSSSRASSNPD